MSTQIMQSVQENELFFEMSAEEAATVSGGTAVDGALALAGILAARPANTFTNADGVTVIATTLTP